jgi:hypothetical protein
MFTNYCCEIAIYVRFCKCNDYFTRTYMFVSACNSSVGHRSVNYLNERSKTEMHTFCPIHFS